MCFGGGDDQYNAYKSGDYDSWKSAFDRQAAIQTSLAKGEIDQATADAQLAAIKQGTPGKQESYTYTVPGMRAGGSSGGSAGEDITKTGTRMVGGTPGVDIDAMGNKLKEDPAASMEMREYMRQHDIGLGRIGIDKSFDQFNDDYYKQYQDDYTGFYLPELDRQYGEVVDKTTAALAGRGVLESSVGANKFADLTRENANARTNITNEATDAANKLKGTVQNAKSSLYNLNEVAANPQAINAQAVGSASALVAPPSYSPLGKVFADAMSSIANFQSAQSNSPTRRYTSPYATGYGSGSVVN